MSDAETITFAGREYSLRYANHIPSAATPESDEALYEQIKQHGIRDPIVTDEKYNLLDGARRLRIAVKLGLKPSEVPFKTEVGLTDEQKLDRVEELNLLRWQRSHEQVNKVIERRILKCPDQNDRTIATKIGVSHDRVGRVRQALEKRGATSHVETRTDTLGRTQRTTKPKKPLPPAPVQEFERLKTIAANIDSIDETVRKQALEDLSKLCKWGGNLKRRLKPPSTANNLLRLNPPQLENQETQQGNQERPAA